MGQPLRERRRPAPCLSGALAEGSRRALGCHEFGSAYVQQHPRCRSNLRPHLPRSPEWRAFGCWCRPEVGGGTHAAASRRLADLCASRQSCRHRGSGYPTTGRWALRPLVDAPPVRPAPRDTLVVHHMDVDGRSGSWPRLRRWASSRSIHLHDPWTTDRVRVRRPVSVAQPR